MFQKRLEIAFISVILIASAYLVKSNYDNYMFEKNPISSEMKQRLYNKEREILQNMKQHYGFEFEVPVVITDKLPTKLYGVTSYENGIIRIYLNKKIMKESMEYMVDSVLPHEYAHALLFKEGMVYNSEAAGHSLEWQRACVNLGGVDCERYVNHTDVIMGKLPF